MAKKILAVDDEKQILDLFSTILSKEGYQVFTAISGRQGLALAREEKPDLILLDINMPEMDGGEVAHKLLEGDQTKNIPIVFLTGIISEKEVKDNMGVIGGRTFFSKYSEPGEIIRKVKEVLRSGE